ncbi:hypothetical protein CG471_12965 [Sphingobium sp. IP1]|nr:hypothetical protein CG471_12965 [Sphingobium sp. IP1]
MLNTMRASSVRFSQPWQYYALLDIFSKFRTEHDIAGKAMIYAACSAMRARNAISTKPIS